MSSLERPDPCLVDLMQMQMGFQELSRLPGNSLDVIT